MTVIANSGFRAGLLLPLHLPLRYSATADRTIGGSGETIAIGHSLVYFRADHTPASGCRIKLAIEWPARLEGKEPLQLVVSGRIQQIREVEAVLEIERHEFRTRSDAQCPLPTVIQPKQVH